MFSFHVLTIGCFSRNKFWGEEDTKAYRNALCTSTLIKGSENNIIVDPSQSGEEMEQTLFNRSGMRPQDIDTIFFTHHHGDHLVGADVFSHAKWYMSEIDIQTMKKGTPEEQKFADRVIPVFSDFVSGVMVVPLPGHTMGNTGLLFNTCDGRVLICGDAIMTRDFFRAECGYYNSVDFELSTKTIQKAAGMTDIIVPGHDNYFLVD